MASKIRWIGELLCGLPSQMDTWSYHEQQAAGFSQLLFLPPFVDFLKGFFLWYPYTYSGVWNDPWVMGICWNPNGQDFKVGLRVPHPFAQWLTNHLSHCGGTQDPKI